MILFHRLALAACLLCSFTSVALSQQKADKVLKNGLAAYFARYDNPAYSSNDKISLEDVRIDNGARTMWIYVNEGFSSQPFTPELVDRIYSEVRGLLRPEYREYRLIIHAQGYPIESLIPVSLMEEPDESRAYRRTLGRGNPWVTPLSLPYRIEGGLNGSHLCVWASHGKYYRNSTRKWVWQRPRLYCTSEDLLTQTIVVPYLIPMLENAGAIVYTPRERDWQKAEAVVDNDTPQTQGAYVEDCDKYAWEAAGTGFARLRQYYHDMENPFEEGTCRMADAVNNKRQLSTIIWQPLIPTEGDYAVYVSYKTMPNSVSDAVYTVMHQGVATEFRVNQRMGGGTWVYLGTFHFSAGCTQDNCVLLTNHSDYRGVVTADAVRFGGGMSNIARCDSTMTEALCTGLPRCLEAARYSAMWNGIPYWVYSVKDNDDYGDDINTRPLTANYVARGSDYLPGDSGICVPLEMSIALHSDAGVRKDSSFIGSLAVCTTDFNEGVTAAGLSRLTSRDFADMVLTQISSDMRRIYGNWNRRQLYDRNYGETREPLIPSVIVEMFSHQNWNDMRYAHDPNFKFNLARSIYKGIGRYLHCIHRKEGAFVPQPLPVRDLSAVVDEQSGTIFLNWRPTEDMTEPSAMPTRYVVYTAAGGRDFDNGTVTNEPTYSFKAEEGVLYRFRVAALNDGGRSLSPNEVCASYGGKDAPCLLLVDAFDRVAAPLTFDTPDSCGFDMSADPGVIDVRSPGFCGYQLDFDKKMAGKTGPGGLGNSGGELEGMVLAGNTHDYSTRHAKDILSAGAYNISSSAGSAFGFIKAEHFRLIDLIFGAQKCDPSAVSRYKTFTPEMRARLEGYAAGGGNILVSGAFIGSDMLSADEAAFTEKVLRYRCASVVRADSIPTHIEGNGIDFDIYDSPNEQNYWVRSVDVIEPCGGAFSTMLHSRQGTSAVTAYRGDDCHVMAFGFPIECITEADKRRAVLTSAVMFLLGR